MLATRNSRNQGWSRRALLGGVLACAGCGGSEAARVRSAPAATAAAASASTAPSSSATASAPACPPPPVDQPVIPFGTGAMVPICRDVYVEPATTPSERDRLAHEYTEARRELASAFGKAESDPPLTIVCKTAPCRSELAGSTLRSRVLRPGQRAPGATYTAGSRVTVLITGDVSVSSIGLLLHEMVHVEMLARLHDTIIPDWFHEGLAFSVANRSMCEGAPAKGIDDLRRLDSTWAHYVDEGFQAKSHATYCQAFAEVDAWLHRHGRERLLALIDAVRAGTPFYDFYGPMLTQSSDKRAPDDTSNDHRALLSNATFDTVTLTGDASSYVLFSGLSDLADPNKPFSIATWIKPKVNGGVLAHVSSNDDGTGWCTPFLGYDGSSHVVAQVLEGNGPEAKNFTVLTHAKALPVNAWAHIAMTWTPSGFQRLYVNGAKVAETTARGYRASGRGSLVHVTWGSSNTAGGAGCWAGAIRPGGFAGSMSRMHVYDTELGADEIAKMARTPP